MPQPIIIPADEFVRVILQYYSVEQIASLLFLLYSSKRDRSSKCNKNLHRPRDRRHSRRV